MVRYGMVWYDMVIDVMVWCGDRCYGMLWYLGEQLNAVEDGILSKRQTGGREGHETVAASEGVLYVSAGTVKVRCVSR